MCDYLGTLCLFGYFEDFASLISILVLELFLIKKTAFVIYKIFINRKNDANWGVSHRVTIRRLYIISI